MKRIGSLLLVLVLAFSAMLLPCSAASQEDPEIIYLEDGSYIVITTGTYSVARSSNTIGGYRKFEHFDANDKLHWTYTLNAQFRYTPGVEAVCTSATCSVEISASGWSCSEKSATSSGAVAIGEATMIKKVFFITTNTVPVHITITCDTYGNLT